MSILPLSALLLAAGLASAPALAESTVDAPWRIEIIPYLFATGMEGPVGTQGVTANTDFSFIDIFKKLDFVFSGLIDARKGPWTFGLDAIYMKLSDNGNSNWQGPLGNSNSTTLDVGFKEQMYQPFVGYRVFDERTKVDLIGGARYTQLNMDATLALTTGVPLLPDGSPSVSGSKGWWDPVIGIRVQTPIAGQWTFVGYGDVGGGGSGDTDFSYQVLAGVSWQFATRYSAKFGYRYFAQDYKKDGFVWDVKMHGPYLGLGILF